MNRLPPHQKHKLQTTQPNNTQNPSLPPYIDHLQQLLTILKCPLCHNQAKQSHMCPNCYKMICQSCLINWLHTKKQQCPNCAKPLKYQLTINCQSLSSQINEIITKISQQLNNPTITTFTPPKPIQLHNLPPNLYFSSFYNDVKDHQLCLQHQLKFDYYCQLCKLSLCPDCAILTMKHQNHKLCKLKQKKLQFQQNVTQLANKLASFKKNIQQLKNQSLQIIQKAPQFQQQKSELFKSYIKTLTDSINSKITTSQQATSKNHRNLTNQLANLTTKYTEMQSLIEQQDKCTLIKQSISFQSQIQKILDNQFKSVNPHKLSLDSQVFPTFAGKTFVINNFELIAKNPLPLYSDILYWNGLEWQLKILFTHKQSTPSPSQQQTFLSIYLQMLRGHSYPNLYKYQIILINQQDFSKSIGCRFENEFQEGSYWGLDHFINICHLGSQHFIHPIKGYLQLEFHVKQSTYFNVIKNQRVKIDKKQNIWKQKEKKIRLMKKLLGFKGYNIKKQWLRSISVRSLIDHQQIPIRYKRSNSYQNKIIKKQLKCQI